jgi:2-methylcitrate dehydratase PrpD
MTITEELTTYCTDLRYDDLPDSTIDYTKKLVLDTMGTTVGGHYWSDTADVMVGTARDLDAGSTGETATVLATGDQLAPTNAALANGALSHSLDYDNRHSPGSLHIGSSVVNAALAAGERAGASGRTFLEAVVAGYDVAARLGMACNPRSSHERGFHPTGTCGAFAATAAIGVVEGFDAEELAAAFGAAGSLASGSYQCSVTGGWNKRIHPGLGARNGFAAVTFATNGFEGPTAPIEGELGFLQAYADRPAPERTTVDLGEVYEAERTKIKPYPLGTFSHAPISLLAEIVAEEGVAPEAVESIVVDMPASGAEMFARSPDADHPGTSVEAQFDMPFAAALAVTSGGASLTAFEDALESEYTETFRGLMERTTTNGSEELEAYLPEKYPARVTVTTADGTYERFQEDVKGEPENPLTWPELRAKFDELASGFDETARDRVAAGVRNVESHTVPELLAPFR